MFSGIYYFLFIVTTECSLSHATAKYSMKEMAEWHFQHQENCACWHSFHSSCLVTCFAKLPF